MDGSWPLSMRISTVVRDRGSPSHGTSRPCAGTARQRTADVVRRRAPRPARGPGPRKDASCRSTLSCPRRSAGTAVWRAGRPPACWPRPGTTRSGSARGRRVDGSNRRRSWPTVPAR
jgi:hypothetical protein